jgi:hypothetical protein
VVVVVADFAVETVASAVLSSVAVVVMFADVALTNAQLYRLCSS